MSITLRLKIAFRNEQQVALPDEVSFHSAPPDATKLKSLSLPLLRYGIASRVLTNLIDLLPIAKNTVALPLPSHSLKVVEEYVGFKRTRTEHGGDWAMAQFILATETDDVAERNRLMGEILKYNEEDVAATWAVFLWLRSLK